MRIEIPFRPQDEALPMQRLELTRHQEHQRLRSEKRHSLDADLCSYFLPVLGYLYEWTEFSLVWRTKPSGSIIKLEEMYRIEKAWLVFIWTDHSIFHSLRRYISLPITTMEKPMMVVMPYLFYA